MNRNDSRATAKVAPIPTAAAGRVRPASLPRSIATAHGTTVILAAGSGARLIVRTVAKGSEAGRELPGGPDVVLLDEWVYSLYTVVVDLATPSGKALTGVFPRTSRRASFVARRDAGGDGGTARVTLSGDINGTLVADPKGRLQRLEFPGSGIVVTRAQD